MLGVGAFSPIYTDPKTGEVSLKSDDVGFCRRAIDDGWYVTVDPTMLIPHRKMRDIHPIHPSTDIKGKSLDLTVNYEASRNGHKMSKIESEVNA